VGVDDEGIPCAGTVGEVDVAAGVDVDEVAEVVVVCNGFVIIDSGETDGDDDDVLLFELLLWPDSFDVLYLRASATANATSLFFRSCLGKNFT
jgi:hypothetical protein